MPTPEQPGQFARLAVGTVEQATEHVQINDDEERRGAGRVHVADQPATGTSRMMYSTEAKATGTPLAFSAASGL